jgi:hypothetical protein
MRQAILGHAGEALASRQAFQAASEYDRDALIEFLKSLQVLPPGTRDLVVDENFHKKVFSIVRSNPQQQSMGAASSLQACVPPKLVLRQNSIRGQNRFGCER